MPSRPRLFAFASPRAAASPGPPSPTFSEVTNASAFNFGSNGPAKIITRTDLKSSLQAYEDVSRLLSSLPVSVTHPRSWLPRPPIAPPSSPCPTPPLRLRMPWSAAAGRFLHSPFSLQHILILPRLKGPTYEAGSRLQAAAGVHHLIGNLWHVLVCTFHPTRCSLRLTLLLGRDH